ncbi:MAG: hypothetical protein JWO16_465 [Sphingomonas bacterium]|jgi:hypothetical protein|nr:hypothetical protein [Sphingomonas bacterium]
MIRALVLMPLLFLAGCGSHNDDVGGVSPEEDRMLNEAAASQDINATTAPDEGVDANSADPGNAQ